MSWDLRAGGASEVLRNTGGAIYLLWSNHIHRLSCDSVKQSVTIQRFVRKQRHSMDPVPYQCLVWPSQMKGFQEARATFKYPVGSCSRQKIMSDMSSECRRQAQFQLS